MHEVIAAIATAPWSSSNFVPSSSVTVAGLLGRPPSVGAARRLVARRAVAVGVAGASEAGKDSSTASSYPLLSCSSLPST